MAAMTTPTCGALAMLAAMTAFVAPAWQKRVALATFVLGGALVPLCLVGYLVWHRVFAVAFDDVILFTATRYAPIQGLPFGSRADAQNYLLGVLFPVAGILTLLLCARDWRSCARDRLLWLATAFGLAGFIGSFPRADVAHIAFNAPLALPLFALCVGRIAAHWRQRVLRIAAASAMVLCVPSVVAFASLTIQTMRSGELVATPRGKLTIFAPYAVTNIFSMVAALPSGDGYFFYPFMPTMPFLMARDQAGKYDVFTPEYTSPLQYQEACVSVLRQADWVIINTRWTDADFLRRAFPAMRNLRPHETEAFEEVLNNAFTLVAQVGTFELRHRRDGVNAAVCADVAR